MFIQFGFKLIHYRIAIFWGSAKVTINGNKLEITIGSQTLIVSLLKVIGGQSKDSS